MHSVASAGNNAGSLRPRKEKRLTYVFKDADESKHCAGVNCLAVLKSSVSDGCDYLFTGSRDGTIKRWDVDEESASCSDTYESHVDWVNDIILVGNTTLISCSSDTTVKTWDCLSNGTCTRTLLQHSDYVTCLAAAGKTSNFVASGGLGGDVFIWDIEAAVTPISKSNYASEDDCSNGVNGPVHSLIKTNVVSSGNSISAQASPSVTYSPIAAKGHKESVYALAMNDTATVLVSGGTEKAVRVWDPRIGSKTMKLRGHTDNIRALLLDSTGRFCLSGSSDSMIRLWDLGQQRCVHTYAVHTDSVWAIASTPTFSHVYSGGRDQCLYLTDLNTRESLLLCTKQHPIQNVALHDDGIWVATTDSSVDRWPAEGQRPQQAFQKGGSFLAGNLSFNRTRVSLEGSSPAPIYKEPILSITGTSAIVQHEVLNNKRHVLTKDTAGSVKLWEVTRGLMTENYGKVSFEEKKEELFEMVSIPSWFTVDTRLGSLSIHLETPQCFSVEMYSSDLNITGKPEDDKVNLGLETLKGLLAHWLAKKRHKLRSLTAPNGEALSGKEVSAASLAQTRSEAGGNVDDDAMMYPQFEFPVISPPSIITEGSHGGCWRKKTTDFDGTEDNDLPWWVVDSVLNHQLPSKDNTKCSFFLHPCEGSAIQDLAQGRLSAPPILRIHKVIKYVLEKIVLESPLDTIGGDGPVVPGAQSQQAIRGDGSFRSGLKPWQKSKDNIEILCNKTVLSPDMSLATVRAFIWKKPDDLVFHYRVAPGR